MLAVKHQQKQMVSISCEKRPLQDGYVTIESITREQAPLFWSLTHRFVIGQRYTPTFIVPNNPEDRPEDLPEGEYNRLKTRRVFTIARY